MEFKRCTGTLLQGIGAVVLCLAAHCPQSSQTRVQYGSGQLPFCPWFRHHASYPVTVHHGLTSQSFWCTHSPVGAGVGGVGVGTGVGADVVGGAGVGGVVVGVDVGGDVVGGVGGVGEGPAPPPTKSNLLVSSGVRSPITPLRALSIMELRTFS